MKSVWSFGVLLLMSGVACAQMHKVSAPETVVRAVGVYEWTGDMAKPTASRLIPVTLYIDKKLEDAGLYLARPVPFALQTGNVYELDVAGVSRGTLDLVYARHLQATTNAQAYDDGWFGYGSFKGLVAPKKTVTRKQEQARTAGIEGSNGIVNPDRPHFVNKAGQPVTPGSASTSAGSNTTKADTGKADTAKADDDPDRPHFSKKDDAAPAKDPSDSAGATPAADPDRPTMKRRSGNDTASTTASSGTDGGTMPADDPDRPTLKRRTPEEAKKRASEGGDSVTGASASLNDDPNRPNLHRGKPTSAMTEADLPKLSGLPVDLQQMVAVSDAKNRPVHDFSRAWEDGAERAAILMKMQAIAQTQLAAYGGGAPAAAQAVAPVARPHSPNSKLRRPIKPLQLAKVPMQDEQLKGYLLSYGDVPTFVYQAHTAGEGADLRYVTIVAQLDAQHEPKMVLHAVTDATHLDRTARLRLVDAVDVEASNRASLLFEMRGQTNRQFGVYRILGLQAEQIFSTGLMQ
ncbi:MAG: hypothetical protein ABI197_13590 [Granulicella sp.]